MQARLPQRLDYQRLVLKVVLVVVAVVDVLVLLTELEESELVLQVADLVAQGNLVSLAEIRRLGKVGVKVRDVCFDF